jgi:hypothetical protein
MQPVPVHRGELVAQRLIKVLNNSLVILLQECLRAGRRGPDTLTHKHWVEVQCRKHPAINREL